MNAWKYQGIPPRQTPAQRAERSARALLGNEWVDNYNAQRVDYYRSLIRQIKESK